jgi:formate dehydrogenase subunit gamma
MKQSAQTIVGERKDLPGAMLPILHPLQNELGFIEDSAVPLVAEALNLSHPKYTALNR